MELDRFRVLLEHWIEHSREHTAKYMDLAKKLKEKKPEVSKLLSEAVERFREGEKLLEEAYNKL